MTYINVKSELEQYAYRLKNQLSDGSDEGFGELNDEEKEIIDTGVEQAIEWLDENSEVKNDKA